MKRGVVLFSSRLMGIMNWITLLLYLQLLWILFTAVGLIIGGIFPATFAVFGVTRKWIRDQPDIPMFKTFLQLYKQAFGKANLIGWSVILLGSSLLYYFNLARSLTGIFSTILVVIIITIAIVYLMTVLFLIPVYVHFDIKILEVIKHAVFIAISYPLHIVAMASTLISFWYLMLYIPALFPFIGLSLLANVLMLISNNAFNSVERKIKQSEL